MLVAGQRPVEQLGGAAYAAEGVADLMGQLTDDGPAGLELGQQTRFAVQTQPICLALV